MFSQNGYSSSGDSAGGSYGRSQATGRGAVVTIAEAARHEGIDIPAEPSDDTRGLTWDYVWQVREHTSMQVLIKGIVTAEDAADCIRHGADAVYVSNHGGRAEASGWGAIDSLPEVVDAVDGRVPVLVDSGFRRGPDIFKALALGADAVCIGRAYVYGLAAFGQAGVEKVLDMLNGELRMVMAQMGTPALADIDARHVGRHGSAGT